MAWLTRFLFSNIGLKVLMALTGALMLLFVLAHMVGNYQVFLGAEALDRYGSFLQNTGELLWVARFGLLGALVTHVAAALTLTLRSWRARPQRYRSPKHWFALSVASRTMLYGGLFIGLFLTVHLLHLSPALFGLDHGISLFTPEYTHCAEIDIGGGITKLSCDVYANVAHGFSAQVWYMPALYILSMVFLGLHLSHGTWSLFRTLGLDSPRYNAIVAGMAVIIGLAVGIGNSLIPLAVLVGVVHL